MPTPFATSKGSNMSMKYPSCFYDYQMTLNKPYI